MKYLQGKNIKYTVGKQLANKRNCRKPWKAVPKPWLNLTMGSVLETCLRGYAELILWKS